MYRIVGAGLALVVILLSVGSVSADESSSETFKLERVETRDTATVLRTIAGIRELTIVDDETIEITGPRAAVTLARELVAALDAEEIDPSASFTTGDDTVVSILPVLGISVREAFEGLQEIKLQRVATVAEPTLLVVRDLPERVELAAAVLGGISSAEER